MLPKRRFTAGLASDHGCVEADACHDREPLAVHGAHVDSTHWASDRVVDGIESGLEFEVAGQQIPSTERDDTECRCRTGDRLNDSADGAVTPARDDRLSSVGNRLRGLSGAWIILGGRRERENRRIEPVLERSVEFVDVRRIPTVRVCDHNDAARRNGRNWFHGVCSAV